MAERFSVNEAAAIAEVSPETIRTALEKKSVTPSYERKTGKAVRHQFSIGDVLFVKVLVEFPFPLSKEDKQSLAQILAHGDRRAARWSREGADIVYRSGDMQVSFECKGFRIPLQHVASLFRKGVPEKEIAEDFPALSARDLAYARLFSRFGERPGRPRKRLVFRRGQSA